MASRNVAGRSDSLTCSCPNEPSSPVNSILEAPKPLAINSDITAEATRSPKPAGAEPVPSLKLNTRTDRDSEA